MPYMTGPDFKAKKIDGGFDCLITVYDGQAGHSRLNRLLSLTGCHRVQNMNQPAQAKAEQSTLKHSQRDNLKR
jgi:hypothetical protein